MNKINSLNLLLKLTQIKKYLNNPISHTLCCKSYIFDKQFNTTEIKIKLDKIRNEVKNKIELASYKPQEMEDILLWFQTNKCKTPMEKCAVNNLSFDFLKSINESKVVQNILHLSNVFGHPLFVSSFILLIMIILIYYSFIINFNIKFPLNSFINILKNSILIKNNFAYLFYSRITQSKYIVITAVIIIILNIGFHIHKINMLLNETDILYHKILKFRMMLYTMNTIVNLYKSDNTDGYETIQYFKTNLSNLYENNTYEKNKVFLLKNRGNIISDFYKISNKKNKLGKLFQLNGQIAYLKL